MRRHTPGQRFAAELLLTKEHLVDLSYTRDRLPTIIEEIQDMAGELPGRLIQDKVDKRLRDDIQRWVDEYLVVLQRKMGL